MCIFLFVTFYNCRSRSIRFILSTVDSRTAGFTDSGKLESFSARSALSLATNMTTRPLIGISAFACISALAVTLLATQTKFFADKYKMDDLRDISRYSKLKFCASIMFRACVIMSSNCFSVSIQLFLYARDRTRHALTLFYIFPQLLFFVPLPSRSHSKFIRMYIQSRLYFVYAVELLYICIYMHACVRVCVFFISRTLPVQHISPRGNPPGKKKKKKLMKFSSSN